MIDGMANSEGYAVSFEYRCINKCYAQIHEIYMRTIMHPRDCERGYMYCACKTSMNVHSHN